MSLFVLGALAAPTFAVGSLEHAQRYDVCHPVSCQGHDPCDTGACAAPPCEPPVCGPGPCVGCSPPSIPQAYVPGADACRGAEQFSFTLHTGSDGNGNALAPGQPDPIWRTEQGGATYAKGPVALWGGTAPYAAWINSYPGGGANGAPGEYAYRTEYYVPHNAYDVWVEGWHTADYTARYEDYGADPIVPVFHRDYTTDPLYDVWRSTVYPVDPGLHRLVVKVVNEYSPPVSPTGFYTELVVHGRCRPVTAPGAEACTGNEPTFSFSLNTGIGVDGAPLPAGVVDPHWNVDFAPGWTHDPYPGWVSSPNARWIDLAPVQTEQPAGPYAYSLEYTLPPLAQDVVISGRFAADNRAILSDTGSIVSLYLGETDPVEGFRQWVPFWASVPGVGPHVLGAQVENFHGVTGLIVEATVSGRCG